VKRESRRSEPRRGRANDETQRDGRAAVSSRPVISVIVPVRDNAAGVEQLIRALAAQTISRERFELVIGDDGSASESLHDMETGNGWVRVIAGPPETSYAARNRAVTAARGGVLAFCDSDCLPDPDWLEAGMAALERADVVAGEVRFVAPSRPSTWSLLTIDMYLDQERNVKKSRAVTANLFVTRSMFDQLGGFDPSLPSGGDYDFARRSVASGARLAYAPQAVVRHPTLDGPRAFLRKAWRTNRWAAFRRTRVGEWPGPSDAIGFVPILGVARARHDEAQPLFELNRKRLAACGVTAGRRSELRALAALYLPVAYAARFGRVRGWIDGCLLLAKNGAHRLPVRPR
jgi:GT2 family glycosyltransferase